MVISELPEPKTAEEARQQAIEWQQWAGEQSLSWLESSHWGEYFEGLATKFELTEEFKENGII